MFTRCGFGCRFLPIQICRQIRSCGFTMCEHTLKAVGEPGGSQNKNTFYYICIKNQPLSVVTDKEDITVCTLLEASGIVNTGTLACSVPLNGKGMSCNTRHHYQVGFFFLILENH